MSFVTFAILNQPNSTNLQTNGQPFPNVSRNYNILLNKHGCEDAYYWYFNQKIYISRQGITFLDDSRNWYSIRYWKYLVIFFVKTKPNEADYQFNYVSSYYPDQYFLYLPYNFYTIGLIFASNCGEHLGGNNLPIQCFSNGLVILSFINLSIPAEAYTNPTPVALYNSNNSTTYPAVLADSNQPTTPSSNITNYQILGNNFDQIIIYPYQGNSLGITWVTQTAQNNPNYYTNYDYFVLNKNAKYLLLNLFRNYNYDTTIKKVLNWGNTSTQLSSVFTARAPICGNGTVWRHPTIAQACKYITMADVTYGTVDLNGNITPGGNTSFYYILSSPDNPVNTTINDPNGYYYWQHAFTFYTGNWPNRFMRYSYTTNPGVPTWINIVINNGTAVSMTAYGILVWDSTVANFHTNWSFCDIPITDNWTNEVYFNNNNSEEMTYPSPQYTNLTEQPSGLLYVEDGCTLFSNMNYAVVRWSNCIFYRIYPTYPYSSYSTIQNFQPSTQATENASQITNIRAKTSSFAIAYGSQIDNHNFTSGMYILDNYIDYKQYYCMRHFPELMIKLPINTSLFQYNTNDQVYVYSATFSLPDIFPNFRYVSLYTEPDLGGIWASSNAGNNLVLYSNINKRTRNKLNPLFTKGPNNVVQMYGEIVLQDNILVYSNILLPAQGASTRFIYFMFSY